MEELVLEWEEVQMRDREPGKQNKGPWNKDRKLWCERQRDTGRNGEKTDICSTRAARLKELSSPAHHRKVFKCRRSLLLSYYWEKSEQQKQREERFGWWVGFKCEKRHRGWGKHRILFWYSERKNVLELVGYVLTFLEKNSSELYTFFTFILMRAHVQHGIISKTH